MLPGETILLTLRLPGTLPPAAARALAAELRQAPAAGADYRRAQKVFFAKFDAALDRAGTGARYFEDEKVAAALAGEFMLLEETGFVVHGFAILPGHAHLVLSLPPGRGLALAKGLELLHARSATACRRLVRPRLPPDAPFWQGSWHDYPVADAAELTRVVAYVRGQPRQAGLPQRFQEWPYLP